jgi:hypothetical protein
MDENINSGFPYLRNAYPISPFPMALLRGNNRQQLFYIRLKTSFVEKGIEDIYQE